MSNARKILDERLAKGEITSHEHEELISKIAKREDDLKQTLSTPQQTDTAKAHKTFGKNKGWVIAGIIGLFIIIGIGNIKKNKTEILNLRSSGFFGNVISGTLITEGKSGTVYLWIEQNGKIMCPRETFIQSNIPQRFEFTCNSMTTSGLFRLLTNRRPKNWVRDNAVSL